MDNARSISTSVARLPMTPTHTHTRSTVEKIAIGKYGVVIKNRQGNGLCAVGAVYMCAEDCSVHGLVLCLCGLGRTEGSSRIYLHVLVIVRHSTE